MNINHLLTRKERRVHKNAFSNKFKRENFPEYVAMQIVYGASLREYVQNTKTHIPEMVIQELELNDQLVAKLKKIYKKRYKELLLQDNINTSDLFIDRKFKGPVMRTIRWYRRRSNLRKALGFSEIDYAYVY